MDKVVALLMLVSVVASSDVLKFQPAEVGVQTAGMKKWDPPFCGGLGCPKYNLVNKTVNYEVRKYMAQSWVSTTLLGMDYREASSVMFMRLFKYIKKQSVTMTAPVKMRVQPGAGPACESNFTMSFFVDPSKGRPPQPSDKRLFIEKEKPMTVYVKSFGGFAMKYTDWKKEALELAAQLKKDNLDDFITDHYYTCGYDSPFKLFNRHNEVWFIKK